MEPPQFGPSRSRLRELGRKEPPKKAGLPESKPPFLAGAGAVFLVRLLLLLYCKYFIFTGPQVGMTISMTMTMTLSMTMTMTISMTMTMIMTMTMSDYDYE